MALYPPPGLVARLLVPATALPLLLAGCGQAQPGTPATFVIAASATSVEPDPELAGADVAMLYQAGADSSDAAAYVVDPNTGQAVTVGLTPRRPDGQVEHGPSRPHLLDQNVNRVRRLLSRQAATVPFDLLAEMAAAIRIASPPGTLLVISSGLSTAGGFDLRRVGWYAGPRWLAAQLKRRGLLPNLVGWRVVFSGLGDTSGAQRPLPLPQRAVLFAYWMAICHAARAAACSADMMTRLEPPSRSTTPSPAVPVPAVVSVRGPRGWAGESLPDDEFFGYDSARLLSGADLVLRPLATTAAAGRRLVSITGYASPDGGSAEYNLTLSLARALAVRNRLVALGVPASQITAVRGLGVAGLSERACIRGGRLDEAVCSRLRRVVVLLGPPVGGPSPSTA